MKKETILLINGKEYDAIINYKVTNYIKYKLDDGKLIISCPYLVSKERLIDAISRSRLIKLINNKEGPNSDKYCWIYGVKQEIQDGFIVVDGHYIIYDKKDLYPSLKKYFYKYVGERLRYYEKLMKINDPYKLCISLMKSRYGSNSRKTHRISINLKLIHYSKDIIDAVIVHELSHCYYFDHSHNFYNFVYIYCPNYKYLHKQLVLENYKGVQN